MYEAALNQRLLFRPGLHFPANLLESPPLDVVGLSSRRPLFALLRVLSAHHPLLRVLHGCARLAVVRLRLGGLPAGMLGSQVREAIEEGTSYVNRRSISILRGISEIDFCQITIHSNG